MFFILAAMATGQAQVELKAGMTITSSVKLKPGSYLLANADGTAKTGALTIRGNNITVDFNGAVLRGTPDTTDPSDRVGTGIRIEGRNITIKNAKVHGYKVGLAAYNSPGIKIIDSDFSFNWKARLMSTQEREDLSDWMSYHRNEKDEWLSYGAGIYLRKCDGYEVKGTRIVGGQNGLMMMESNKGLAWNNNFSFLSSLGIGMYLSSDNRIMHNKIDWALRGFSYGVYNRGQDSAGILIYEQSHRNTFAYNSVTHGGDGFFLWAGQTTMDTGKGGCNDNILYANDFSHAPTNGIEATFSRNVFANNLLLECWHGIWGGYSYETKIAGNVFGYNAEGIAIEHGQDNEIRGNTFHRDNESIVLWWNDRPQDPNWGYPKFRDTRSMRYAIVDNYISNAAKTAMRLNNSLDVHIKRNLFDSNATVHETTGKSDGQYWWDNVYNSPADPKVNDAQQTLKIGDAFKPMAAASSLAQGKSFGDPKEYASRFVTEWDPYLTPAQKPKNPTTPEEKRRVAALAHYVAPLKGGMNPFLKKGAIRGWRYMIVDEWGPYDFKRPLLWSRGPSPDNPEATRFEILGPAGQWKSVSGQGVASMNRSSGSVPGFVDVVFDKNNGGQIKVNLEYTGMETVDYRGIRTAAGKAVPFGYEVFKLPMSWTVKQWNYDLKQIDPREKYEEWTKMYPTTPVYEGKFDEINFAWGGSPNKGINSDYFATLAEGTVTAPAGDYILNVTSDDGVRVWVDDKRVIDNWTYHGPEVDTAELKLNGTHRIRVEHFELNGYSALKVELKPKR